MSPCRGPTLAAGQPQHPGPWTPFLGTLASRSVDLVALAGRDALTAPLTRRHLGARPGPSAGGALVCRRPAFSSARHDARFAATTATTATTATGMTGVLGWVRQVSSTTARIIREPSPRPRSLGSPSR